jgi:hypothetical protein
MSSQYALDIALDSIIIQNNDLYAENGTISFQFSNYSIIKLCSFDIGQLNTRVDLNCGKTCEFTTDAQHIEHNKLPLTFTLSDTGYYGDIATSTIYITTSFNQSGDVVAENSGQIRLVSKDDDFAALLLVAYRLRRIKGHDNNITNTSLFSRSNNHCVSQPRIDITTRDRSLDHLLDALLDRLITNTHIQESKNSGKTPIRNAIKPAQNSLTNKSLPNAPTMYNQTSYTGHNIYGQIQAQRKFNMLNPFHNPQRAITQTRTSNARMILAGRRVRQAEVLIVCVCV